jgi:hypothetical protein
MDSMTGFFSILGFIAIFFAIMAGLVNTCMTVMYILPDAIFSFMGARNSATADIGRNEAGNMKGIVAANTGVLETAKPGNVGRMADVFKPKAKPGDGIIPVNAGS